MKQRSLEPGLPPSALALLLLSGLCAQGCNRAVTHSPVKTHAQALSCIAVLPFAAQGISEIAGLRVSELVANELLTSGQFDLLEPAEAKLLLGKLPHAVNDPAQARYLGEKLGVQAVLVGSVSEYTRRELSLRNPGPEPVVAFSARLVEVSTGRVVWSTSASNYESPLLQPIPTGISEVALEVVRDAFADLIAARRPLLAERRVCWNPSP